MSGFFHSRCVDQVHPCWALCGNSWLSDIPLYQLATFDLSVHHVCIYLQCVFFDYWSSPVESFRHIWLFATPWTAACQASLFIINSQSLFIVMSIELVMSSNHLILWHPHLLPTSVFPRVFPRVLPSESVLCIRWSKYWSFSFNISLPNKYSGMSSFKMDCSDPLVVQGTLKSLLQHLLQHKIFTGQKHQFFSMQISLYSTSNIHTFGFQYPMNTCIHMFVCKYASSFPLSVQLGVVWWAHMVTGVNIFRTY